MGEKERICYKFTCMYGSPSSFRKFIWGIDGDGFHASDREFGRPVITSERKERNAVHVAFGLFPVLPASS